MGIRHYRIGAARNRLFATVALTVFMATLLTACDDGSAESAASHSGAESDNACPKGSADDQRARI